LKPTLVLAIFVLTVTASLASFSEPITLTEDERSWEAEHMVWGYPGTEELIYTEHFIISHNNWLREPNWACYHLTAEDLMNGVARFKGNFQTEESLEDYQTATHYDYTRSGFDRGHMAPSGDMRKTKERDKSTFRTSNIVPQTPSLNQGSWATLEGDIRALCEDKGELYVITGPVYLKPAC